MDYSVISDVSETLRQVLEDGLSVVPGAPRVEVHNLRSRPAAPKVSLFLYEVIEDPSTRNRPRVRVPAQATGRLQTRKPDLTLLLRYLITPWIEEMAPPYTDQLILGRLAQVLYEHALLQGADLKGSTLPRSAEVLKVTMAPITLEDRTRIWNCLQLPYRTSLTYEVRVANITPELSSEVSAVGEARFAFGDLVEGRP